MRDLFTIFPLGDAAATIDLGNTISEALNNKVIAMQRWMLQYPFTGQKDIVIAYSSLSVIYDPGVVKHASHVSGTVFNWVAERLEKAYHESSPQAEKESAVISLPVCYEEVFGHDLPALAAAKQLSVEEIIHLHTSREYRVYTIGFLPGFSYMAEVEERLVTPRKVRPEPVTAGSVAIAGSQTGIYPLNSPGGWHIIGRTPVKQFDPGTPQLVKLKVGDRVRFYPISRQQFENDPW